MNYIRVIVVQYIGVKYRNAVEMPENMTCVPLHTTNLDLKYKDSIAEINSSVGVCNLRK